MHIVTFEVYLLENNMSLLDLEDKIDQEVTPQDLIRSGWMENLWGAECIINKNACREDHTMYSKEIVNEWGVHYGEIMYFPKRFKSYHNIIEWQEDHTYMPERADLRGKIVIDIDVTHGDKNVIIPVHDILDINLICANVNKFIPKKFKDIYGVISKLKVVKFKDEE
jgi:hypothetical protein